MLIRRPIRVPSPRFEISMGGSHNPKQFVHAFLVNRTAATWATHDALYSTRVRASELPIALCHVTVSLAVVRPLSSCHIRTGPPPLPARLHTDETECRKTYVLRCTTDSECNLLSAFQAGPCSSDTCSTSTRYTTIQFVSVIAFPIPTADTCPYEG